MLIFANLNRANLSIYLDQLRAVDTVIDEVESALDRVIESIEVQALKETLLLCDDTVIDGENIIAHSICEYDAEIKGVKVKRCRSNETARVGFQQDGKLVRQKTERNAGSKGFVGALTLNYRPVPSITTVRIPMGSQLYFAQERVKFLKRAERKQKRAEQQQR